MSRSIACLDEVTADWCEATLREHGWLARGRVRSLEVTPGEAFLSRVASLDLEYSADASHAAPRHLFLKLSKPGLDRGARESCEREMEFYREISPLEPGMPTVRPYAALSGNGGYCLLLQDMSRSHIQLADVEPNDTHAGLVIDALAGLHAAWWDDPRLTDRLARGTRERFVEYVAGSKARYRGLVEELGDELTRDWRRVYLAALDEGPRLALARVDRGSKLTLCHHDCHDKNFLVPRPDAPECGDGGRARIVDWHVYSRWWGAQDVVKFHFFTGRTDLAEKDALLRRYHARLLDLGVTGYTREDFLFDCRLSVLDLLLHVMDYEEDRGPLVAKAMRIYDELGCGAVF